MKRIVSRRNFLKTAGALTAVTAFGSLPSTLMAGEAPRLVKFPEKTELILLSSRPPQLETPLKYFKELITPNDALFVRWHSMDIPTSVDVGSWKLNISGNTEKELNLSLDDIKKDFEKVTYTAVMQCSGNGRSFFQPRVQGGQWLHGAMGNVTWSGARLKDILNKAGLKKDSVDVAFNGLDTPDPSSIPDFKKSLPVDKALEEEVFIAYEMNGEPLTMLNGFPVRLVVPGWYATYWVKALSDITVLTKEINSFWMKPAYRIPDTPGACVAPGASPKHTIPINRMNTKSVVVEPEINATLKSGAAVDIMGLAFSGGYSIKDVLVSMDNGKTWAAAELGKDKGRYSWAQWRFTWKPVKPGKYSILARATNSIGDSQPFESLWNPSGFMWNKIESIEVNVV
ncbi:MAG: molybdopterin-dependent oxidoreductase [Nitrospirae bacterium]|nr:molybdopterin-dependent oxidoreductase [Nitrospirota bacterium]